MSIRPLTGRLLVAHAGGSPLSSHTVVLALEHTDDGAIGVVLNRPSEFDVNGVPRETLTAIESPS